LASYFLVPLCAKRVLILAKPYQRLTVLPLNLAFIQVFATIWIF
jgi:hypothetical protein